MQDTYDYYDRYEESRDLFERRYSSMGGMRGRDFLPPMGRRDPMPLPPPLGSSSMRGLGSSSSGGGGGGPSMRSSGGSVKSSYDAVFSRRSPPPRSSNGMSRFS